jgi:hypothetical protein
VTEINSAVFLRRLNYKWSASRTLKKSGFKFSGVAINAESAFLGK